MENKPTETSRAEIHQQKDGSFRMAGYEPPNDWTITFSTDSDNKKTILHVPFEDVHTMAHLLNDFLQSKGVKSYIEEK